MKKPENHIFNKFLQKVSEYNNKSDFHYSTNQKDKQNNKYSDKYNLNNYDVLNMNNYGNNRPVMDNNKGKMFMCDNNTFSKNNKNEEDLKQCFRTFEYNNKYSVNNYYTNPFQNSNRKNRSHINEEDNNNYGYKNDKSKYSYNYYNNQNDTNDDSNNNYLENSKNSNDDGGKKLQNISVLLLNDKEKSKINNINSEQNDQNKKGNKLLYFLFGSVASISAIFYLYKKKKLPEFIQTKIEQFNFNSLLERIKLFVKDIESNKTYEGMDGVIVYLIEYLIKKADELSDIWRLLGIIILIFVLWYAIKSFIKYVFKCFRRNQDENNEIIY